MKKRYDAETREIEANLRKNIEDEFGGTSPAAERDISGADETALPGGADAGGRKKSSNREIIIVSYVCMAIFVSLIGYFVFFLAKDKTEMLNNPYNKLQGILEEYTVRGKILASGGEVLAVSKTDAKGNETREYPYDNMFAHAVGYTGNGKTGIESEYNMYLLTSSINPVFKAIKELEGEKYAGDNVVTTLDVGLQKTAYNALGSYKGAVLAMDPDTGAVSVMVSKPDYDPNKIVSDWKNLTDNDSDSVLINRVTQGLYPPGSTFKLVTLLEYIREHSDYASFEYKCSGVAEIDGVKVNCHNKKPHGSLDIYSALAKSCNGAFAVMGMQCDIDAYNKTCRSLLFNSELPYSGVYNKSVFSLNSDSDAGLITQTAFGQGDTMITPMHNGLIVSAVANGGYLVTPHLVDRISSSNGGTVRTFSYERGSQIMKEDEIKVIKKAMKEVTGSGTAAMLSGQPYKVFGKTGSAEYNSSGASHAWFVGYAKKGDKKLAVSIIVEGAGTGSEFAVPIAKKIFDAYY